MRVDVEPGDMLRLYREAAGVQQQDLARELKRLKKMHPSTLVDIEKKRITVTDATMAEITATVDAIKETQHGQA